MAAAAASAAGANGRRRSAAFFDLDRTLMAGSSGLPYARAAHKAGWLPTRTMLRWGVDHFRFRLRGANEEATARVLAEAREVLTGVELTRGRGWPPAASARTPPGPSTPIPAEVAPTPPPGRPPAPVTAPA